MSCATGGKVFDQRRAEFGLAVAAVAQEKQDKRPDRFKLYPVNHAAAMTLGADEARPGENAEVGGHGVVWNIEAPCDLTSRQAIRLLPYQEAKHFQACRLRNCREGRDSRFSVHMSRIADSL